MKQLQTKKLAAGDLVVVRPMPEILSTLDARGTLHGLVFMPEMIEYCGQQFRVSRRAEQVCIDGAPVPHGESRVRGFSGDDVVLLTGLRCSGALHGACKRGCTLFWREAWLRPVGENAGVSSSVSTAASALAALPPPQASEGTFYCQSSDLPAITYHLPFSGRVRNSWRNVWRRNYGALEMFRMLSVWGYWRVRQRISGVYPRGNCKPTPNDALDLQSGEWVTVKSLEEITATLDEKGKNRGLHFSSDMVPYCGRRLRVRCRADNLIAEGSGIMRHLRNTVILEGSNCDSAIYAFGGCPREDLLYWREIWLHRSP